MAKKTYDVEVLALIDDMEIDDRHRLQARIVCGLRPLHLKEGTWMHGQHLIKLKPEMLEQIIDSALLVKVHEAFKKLGTPE